jgi:hypothetical protein
MHTNSKSHEKLQSSKSCKVLRRCALGHNRWVMVWSGRSQLGLHSVAVLLLASELTGRATGGWHGVDDDVKVGQNDSQLF